MLPAGLTADLAPSKRRALHHLHPTSRTVAQLLVGACSCDLVRHRHSNPLDDERELRTRYRDSKISRSEIIKSLEQHRRGPLPRPQTPGGWPIALAAFVVEHARNAGPTLYLLDFEPHASGKSPEHWPEPLGLSAREVREDPAHWLVEGRLIIVG